MFPDVQNICPLWHCLISLCPQNLIFIAKAKSVFLFNLVINKTVIFLVNSLALLSMLNTSTQKYPEHCRGSSLCVLTVVQSSFFTAPLPFSHTENTMSYYKLEEKNAKVRESRSEMKAANERWGLPFRQDWWIRCCDWCLGLSYGNQLWQSN